MNDGTDLFCQEGLLSTFSPPFTVHMSFKNLAYVGACLIMSSRGMLTFTCLSTYKISVWLMAFFLAFSACEKGGGVLFFTTFSLIGSSSCLVSFFLLLLVWELAVQRPFHFSK